MNKKGFTLTELIAIIVVISIIALIAVPAVVNSIKNNNHDSYTGVINNIILASETYAANMGAAIKQVSVETLKQAGYLPVDLKNPIDNTNLNGCVYVVDGDAIYKEESCSTIISNVTGVRLYKDGILNGLDPVLTDGLIPVTIDNNGTVRKASLSDEWYNYAEKKWANAVILKGSDTYQEGDIILDGAIDAYFVWIPKFKYKLFDMGNYTAYAGTSKPENSIAHSIDIVFDPVNTTDSDTSCVTPLTSGASGNCAVGKYMTHPSFITLGVNGYWVGKFEVSGSISDLDVKPNASALKSKTAGEFFTALYNYKRDMDSHMMKNTEWGAVAYLSLSNYGINTEVRINNSSNRTTGCAATVANTTNVGVSQSNHSEGYYSGCENAFQTPIGVLASTTGNVTGIYDMSGGAWEYMASYISGNVGSSGLNPSNYDSKYFDVYNASSSIKNYNYRILGDATGEMGPFYRYADSDGTNRNHSNWFEDYSHFPDASYPLLARGSYYAEGVLASQVSFCRSDGVVGTNRSTRLVLAPKEEIKHEYAIGTTWDFPYTGSIQEFIPADSGKYKLEVWGAQGGYYSNSYIGGYGGYSTGTASLSKGNTIYVVVGGKGASAADSVAGPAVTVAGGYNGGGNGYTWLDTKFESGGGGATHMATSSGLLSSLNSNRNAVLIVAGGGGGAGGTTENVDLNSKSGDGGGYVGNVATGTSYTGTGGTQTSGGNNHSYINQVYTSSGFGQGASACTVFDASTCGNASGGGAGYFGGGAGCGAGGFGGGGSGYIGSANLIDKKMVCYNCTASNDANTKTISNTCTNANPTVDCSKQGNGYARITLVSY